MLMPRLIRAASVSAALVCAVTTVAAAGYSTVADWLKLPAGRPQLGNMHGDIAVSSKGEVFVSVQDPAAGLQVTRPTARSSATCRTRPATSTASSSAAARGRVPLRRRAARPDDRQDELDGTIVMTIGSAAIPDEFKVRNARSNELQLLLTGLDVAPNGDLYVADGYASDFIHRFDKTGKYLASFGGKKPPYSFNTLHKLAIDTRFQPARIIAWTAPTTASCTCRSTASSSASWRRTCCCRPPSR